MNFISRSATWSALRLAGVMTAALGALPAQAQTPSPLLASSHNYDYTISFTTPSPFLTVGAGNVVFQFNPEVVGATPATATASNLTYSSGWQAGFPSTFGSASIDYFTQTATIKNTSAANGFNVPVKSFGQNFSFNLAYADPPGPTATDFSIVLQAGGLKDQSLFDLQFNPDTGQVVLLGTTNGVTITPASGTPPIVPAAVPEASTTVSLGLLLSLGGAVIVVKRKKAHYENRQTAL